jgi:hypothetical protein
LQVTHAPACPNNADASSESAGQHCGLFSSFVMGLSVQGVVYKLRKKAKYNEYKFGKRQGAVKRQGKLV